MPTASASATATPAPVRNAGASRRARPRGAGASVDSGRASTIAPMRIRCFAFGGVRSTCAATTSALSLAPGGTASSVCVAPAFEIRAQSSERPRQVGMSASGSGSSASGAGT